MDISKRVYQRLRLIGYGTVPDFFCCSAEYRQQINRRTNPCPTPSHLPPLSKVRCCRPKKFGRLPEGLLAPLRFAPHSYRPLSKVRCCRPKKFGRLPKGLSHHPLPLHQPFQNRTIPRKPPTPLPLNERSVGFASVQSPWAHTLRHPCLALHHHPCLPSKKGRWLDGIAKPLFYIIFIL